MDYHRYNESFEYIGTTQTQPGDSLWTNIGYTELFIKPTWNGTQWAEGATNEQLQLANQDRIKSLKLDCYNELQPTDWYFIRKQETGQEVPQDILTQRANIRIKYDLLINE
jgi:hypothetical protein